MFKKIFAFMICALLLLSVTGCQKPNEEPKTEEPEEVTADWCAHFLNIGKADCCIIEIDDLFYMIDTGTKGDHDVVIRALTEYRIRSIEAVFITHCDKDHIGGLKKLMDTIEVKTVYGSEFTVYDKKGVNELDDILKGFMTEPVRLSVGDTVPVGTGDAKFTVLAPSAVDNEDDNNNSLVLRLDGCGNTALFMGDCETEEETPLINGNIDCDLLKVGNHGRKSASTYSFLRNASPTVAVITTDPVEEPDTASDTVLSNLALVGATAYITADFDLAVTVTSIGGALEVEQVQQNLQ